MRTLRSRPPTILLLASMVAPAIGCSNQVGRSDKLETASSTAVPASVPDSGSHDTSATIHQADTTNPAPKQSTPTAPAPASPPRASAATTKAPAPVAGSGQAKWLAYDAAKNTVTFELVAGPFTFNGFRSGDGSLVVPPKANVVMNFVNKDGTPHSAEIISGEGPIPNAGGEPAIARAYTNKLLEGLPQEATDVMQFTAPESGTYRIFCGVPGHGLSGMWIWFKVDPAVKAPSFGPTKQ